MGVIWIVLGKPHLRISFGPVWWDIVIYGRDQLNKVLLEAWKTHENFDFSRSTGDVDLTINPARRKK